MRALGFGVLTDGIGQHRDGEAAPCERSAERLRRRFKSTEVFSGDITRSEADVVVSSDDTLLSGATGGVTRAIVTAAGIRVKCRLRELAAGNVPRGYVAITEGGMTKFKYILHAVTLTKARDYTQYPSREEIARLVERILAGAEAIGVASLAIPELAGGTAVKTLREQGLKSEQDMIWFIFTCLAEALNQSPSTLKTIFLIVHDNRFLTPS